VTFRGSSTPFDQSPS